MSIFDVASFERQGNTEHDIHFDNSEGVSNAICQIADSALRTIKIFTPNLEKDLYDNECFREVLLKFARGNRQAQIQILATDTTTAIHHGHRLIPLAQQIPSSMEIRNTPEDYQDTSISFILIDQSSFIFKPDHASKDAIQSECKHRANKLQEFFTPAWEQAEQDPHTRRFSI